MVLTYVMVMLMGIAIATASSTSHVNTRVVYKGAGYLTLTSSTQEPPSTPPPTSSQTTSPSEQPATPLSASEYPSTTDSTTTSSTTDISRTSSTTDSNTTSSPTEESNVAQAPKSSPLTYNPVPYSFHRSPSYHQRPHYGHRSVDPACAANTTKSWCIEDDQYPTYEVKHAVSQHYEKVLSLYANLDDLSTELSVNGLTEETYLCPSETTYIRPLRAKNTEGKWRLIVNHINIHYVTLSQTTRIEECLTPGEDCPLVPECYDSTCLQKSIYHRFLVYDPYDQYFPFAIETFKLPASCACLLDSFNFDS